MNESQSKLLAIIANLRGAQDACSFDEITFLGFPFSISETFQQRNTNSSINESLTRVEEIQELCGKSGKKLLVYISMAFGNPYGDEWHPDIAVKWLLQLKNMGIKHFALADTIGSSTPENIATLFGTLLPQMGDVELGAHLHSTKEKAMEKIAAAYNAGCRRFDSAIHGFGGCPMAKEELTGNIATEIIEQYAREKNMELRLNTKQLNKTYQSSWKIFDVYK